MDPTSRLLHQIHARYAPVDARVAEILDHIRSDCKDLDLKQCNADNERQVEQFIARLEAEFPGRVVIQRQRLSRWAVRTTRWNYLFTVPGESDEQLLLVAHYDTWRGPGADDNTTGEEILKQYLLSDLQRPTPPKGAVVSIDSVGEGRLYIPRETMGADFIRVLIPFGDYDSLNDLLEEAAHLHGIKYNNFLAGGTTDHVSFLEVNNGLWARAADGLRRLASRISGRPYVPPRD